MRKATVVSGNPAKASQHVAAVDRPAIRNSILP
jgi:hypothetical protein